MHPLSSRSGTNRQRQRGLPPELAARRLGISPPPPVKLPSKRWHDLILWVWHVDPLRCPVCQNPMRVIAVIDDPRVVEKILPHLGAWHDPPPRPLPLAGAGPYIYEPCEDVDPMPDYESVLADRNLPPLWSGSRVRCACAPRFWRPGRRARCLWSMRGHAFVAGRLLQWPADSRASLQNGQKLPVDAAFWSW